jgi:hypothetical protein
LAGHVVGMGEKMIACNILVGKTRKKIETTRKTKT